MSLKSIDIPMPAVPLKRKSQRRYLRILLPSVLVILLAFVGFTVVLSYQIIYPDSPDEATNPGSYLLPYQELSFAGQEGSHPLWFIPGLKGSPAIFLCHDYGSNRVALLNLGTLLRESGYNIFLIAFRGHGDSQFSRSTLGLREGDDLARAIDFAIRNLAVNESAVGIWGVSLGAHAAIRAALQDDRVRILILDSPYPSVADCLNQQVAEHIGFESRIVGAVVGTVFSLYLWTSPFVVWEDLDVRPLFPVRTLYVAGLEAPSFARWTRQLYAQAEGRKDILLLPRSRKSLLLTSELKDYDNRIVRYFQRYLPR